MSASFQARHRTTAIQFGAAVVGAVFLLVGAAGFIPGITSNTDTLEFAGRDSSAELLGIFQVSVLHNIVHLAFGVLGLLAYRSAKASALYLYGGGVLYLVLTLYGAAIDLGEEANFVPVNTADNWLHLALGLGMIALAAILARATMDAADELPEADQPSARRRAAARQPRGQHA
ncbi:MAG: DUF4383 domain-containing protein [Actinomycetota bacterium]|nr:DUF4383 domain-containing protein [Actinomycetota bacterium]